VGAGLTADSLLDLLARFIHLEVIEAEIGGKKVCKENMIFPRHHQRDAVRKIGVLRLFAKVCAFEQSCHEVPVVPSQDVDGVAVCSNLDATGEKGPVVNPAQVCYTDSSSQQEFLSSPSVSNCREAGLKT